MSQGDTGCCTNRRERAGRHAQTRTDTHRQRPEAMTDSVVSAQSPCGRSRDDAWQRTARTPSCRTSGVRSILLPLLSMAVAAMLTKTLPTARAARSCTANSQCREWIGPESTCIVESNTCSNRYLKGCLHTTDPDRFPVRICNSNDPPGGYDGREQVCLLPEAFNYTEVRIHHSNWESSIFYAWIMEIMLSERLGVPVAIGSDGDFRNSFYSPVNTLEYAAETYPFGALEVANYVHDCRTVSSYGPNDSVLRDIRQRTLNPNDCVHVLPEVWSGAASQLQQAVRQEIIDPVEGDGQVGKISWYIPLRTAKEFPEFTSWHGLTEGQRDEFIQAIDVVSPKRRQLASIFNRPVTWQEYCDDVSENNCAEPDDWAERAPQGDDEGSHYFVQGLYKGHFRPTIENNCDENPGCTGHIVAPPCSWSSFLDAQIYWNNIPMASSGPNNPNNAYSYSQMIEVWKAAEATESHVMMWWWTPEALVETFRDTEYGFQQILLPEATSTCKRARLSGSQRCSLEESDRRGTIEGSCDNEAHALQKAIASSLGRDTLATPPADRSPAYDFIGAFKIDNLDMNEILFSWLALQNDPYGHDARQAVCDWIVENIEGLEDFIPLGYPRELSLESTYDRSYLVVAQVMGGIVAFSVIVVGGIIFYRRKTRVMVFAQVDFILLLICGFFLVTVAAIVYVLEPSSGVCVGREWLMAVGYTLELIPLVVKFAALNQVVQSSRKMKRVRISVVAMYMKVIVTVVLVMAYLAVWTVLDAPQKVENRELVEEGGTLVESTLKCDSDSWAWEGMALGWQGLLLIAATVLAVQTRSVQQEFNESRSLGTLVYSHFMFIILRILVNVLENQGTIAPNIASGTISFLLSFDVLFGMCIYIAPKLIEAHKKPQEYRRQGTVSDPDTGTHPQRTNNQRQNMYSASLANGLRNYPSSDPRSAHGSGSSQTKKTLQMNAVPVKAPISDIDEDDSSSDHSTENRFCSSLDEVEDRLRKKVYDVSTPIVEETYPKDKTSEIQ